MIDAALTSAFARGGTAGTLRHVVSGSYDAASGTVAQTTVDIPLEHAIVGSMMINTSRRGTTATDGRSKGLVLENTIPVTLQAAELNGVVPTAKDRFVFASGEEAEILDVATASWMGQPTSYYLTCKGNPVV